MEALKRLSINGGVPVRRDYLPYGKQWVDDEDVAAVLSVLRSDWLTTGPSVSEFEQSVAQYVGVCEAVAVSNGTAALHACMSALKIGPGDQVLVPPMTFAATANSVVFCGATPVFVDVDPDTLLIDVNGIDAVLVPQVKAVVAVDYAGHPCDYDMLRSICDHHGLLLVSDACHSLGGEYRGRRMGSLADLSAFSLHPVKNITCGEGGIITTNNPDYAQRIRMFRNHGITTDHRQRESENAWFYEMADLGYNYRLTDLQCALGQSQLRRLAAFVARRAAIARRYSAAFRENAYVQPLSVRSGVLHAWHLYVVRIDTCKLSASRDQVFRALRAEGIGVNVHYIPVHLHPYYRKTFATAPGLCPVAEEAYEHILTLPIFPRMSDGDVDDVIHAVTKVTEAYAR